MMKERRMRTRVSINFELDIVVKGEKINVQTNNISMTGVSFISPHHFKVGEHCIIDLYLSRKAHLSIKAKILRSQNQETIASFLEMNEESFFHLKRLIQFNTSDPDQIEKELDKPAF